MIVWVRIRTQVRRVGAGSTCLCVCPVAGSVHRTLAGEEFIDFTAKLQLTLSRFTIMACLGWNKFAGQ